MSFLNKKFSVDAVLKTFTRAIEDLQEVETNNRAENEKQLTQAALAMAAAHAAARMADRASEVRTKLEAIVL